MLKKRKKKKENVLETACGSQYVHIYIHIYYVGKEKLFINNPIPNTYTHMLASIYMYMYV